MAATVTGVFQIIDRASGPMRNMERQAKRTDLAIKSIGDSMDDIGTSQQLSKFEQVERKMRDVDRQATSVGGRSGSIPSMGRSMRDAGGDADGLSTKLGRVAAALTGVQKIIGVMKIPLLVTGIGALVQAVGALAGGAAAMAPALVQGAAAMGTMLTQVSQLTPVLVGYPAILGSIALAVGTATLAFQGFGDAVTEGGEAMKKLEPRARAVAELLRGAGRQFLNDLRQSASGGFFGQVTPSLLQSTLLKGRTQKAANQVVSRQGQALGRGASVLLSGATTPTMLRQITSLSETSAGMIERAAVSANNFAYALADVLMVARPFLNWMSKGLQSWSQYIQDTAQARRQTGAMAESFARARIVMRQMFTIAGNLFDTLKNVRDAGEETGDSLWDAAQRGSRRWEQWTGSFEGQNRMANYFDGARDAVHRVWEVTKNLGGTLLGIGRAADEAGDSLWYSAQRATQGWEDWSQSLTGQTNMRVFFENIREPVGQLAGLVGDLGLAIARVGAAPGFSETVATLRQAVGPLEHAITALGGNMGPAVADLVVQVSRLIDMVAQTGGGALGRFVDLFAGFLDVVLDIVDAIPGLDRLFGAAILVGGTVKIRQWASSFGALRAAIMETVGALRALQMQQAQMARMPGMMSPGIGGGGVVPGYVSRSARGRGGAMAPTGASQGGFLSGLAAGASGMSFAGGGKMARFGERLGASRVGGAVMSGASRLGSAGRAAGSLAARIPGVGMAGSMIGGAARFLGPVGLGISGAFALKQALDTEGGLDRKLQGFGSGLTFGIIPQPRTADEAYAQGQTMATDALDEHVSIEKLTGMIAQHKQVAANADQWDKAQIEGMLSVEEERLKVQKEQRNQRRIQAADRAFSGQDGILEAFDIRRRSDMGIKGAAKATGQDVLDSLKSLRGKGREAMAQNYVAWAQQMEQSNPKLKGLADDAGRAIERRFKQMGRRVEVVNGEVWRSSDLQWSKISDALSTNAERARQEVTRAFTEIQKVAVQELQRMGYSRSQAENMIRIDEKGAGWAKKNNITGSGLTERGNLQNRAAGTGVQGAHGVRLPGVGVGDSVPLVLGMAAPGELVVNRHTEKRVNAMLGMHGTSLGREVGGETRKHSDSTHSPYPYAAYGNRFAKGGIVSLGHQLQQQGFLVSENPAFGGVDPVHAPGSYHYSGQALDVNWPNVGQEPAKLDALYARLKKMAGVIELLWRVPDHFDHLHVAMSSGASGRLQGGGLGGPAGALAKQLEITAKTGLKGMPGALAQRGLDLVAGGAEEKLNKALAAQGGGMMGGKGATGGSLNSWLTQALKITGHYSPRNLAMLRGRAMQESGGDPNAVNNWDSNAAMGDPSKGLLQTIGATFSQYAMPGLGGIFNPVSNAVAAIRYMYARYGHIVGPSGGGYATGGRLPNFAGWFGDGGTFATTGPTLMGVGEKGREVVSIASAGKGMGGGVTIEGGLHIHNEKGETKDQIKKAVEDAFRELEDELDHDRDDDEVLA